jgi:hypothetical protein
MALSLTSASPHQVRTIEEAQVLIDEAYAQEIFCRRIKELSEVRAKEAIAEACIAYKNLLDAEMQTGRVFYVVKTSGFQAQNPTPAQPPVVVQISGGADCLSQTSLRSNHLLQHITQCLFQGMESWKSSWTECFDCIVVLFTKTQPSFLFNSSYFLGL